MLGNIDYEETGEVLGVDRSCSGLVWLAALTEAVAEGRMLGPCSGRGVNGTKGVGQCWARAHLCGKKREVLVQRSRMCSENTVFKEIQGVLAVDRWCWGPVARRDAAESLWDRSTV